MKAAQIFDVTPGTRILLYCEEGRVRDLTHGIYTSIPDTFRERTSLNSCSIISMDMCGDEAPNSFHDLAALCSRLVISAGKRSHFEGLLMLNISNLIGTPEDVDRLKALGELLSLCDGLASECITLFYGPTDEKEVLIAANNLDFDGRLRVESFEGTSHEETLHAMLAQAHMCCRDEHAIGLLQSTIEEMQGVCRFDPLHFLQSCAARDGAITDDSVQASLIDPFSYVNRLKKTMAILLSKKASDRRIGFQSHE